MSNNDITGDKISTGVKKTSKEYRDNWDKVFGKPINKNPCCHKCLGKSGEYYFGMLLCKTCGNKRCPHASDHNLECTNSNAAGQKGSVYE